MVEEPSRPTSPLHRVSPWSRREWWCDEERENDPFVCGRSHEKQYVDFILFAEGKLSKICKGLCALFEEEFEDKDLSKDKIRRLEKEEDEICNHIKFVTIATSAR